MLKKIIYAFGNLFLLRKTPTLVYAPGRVGSMGLLKNLRAAGIFSFKVEFLESRKLGSTKFVKIFIINPQRPANIISLVREPMGMLLSYFLDKCAKGWIQQGTIALRNNNIDKLKALFVEEVINSSRLDTHLFWYENELNKQLKINIFHTTFDYNKKFTSLDFGTYKILLLRSDLPDDKKSVAINQFHQTTSVKVSRENQGKDKSYGEIQAQLKTSLKLPLYILEKIYAAQYVTHFFSPEEIDELKKQWSSVATQ